MAGKLPQKLVRRLAAAEGYLELGMPQHALDELALEPEYGVLEAPAEYLRGMAFKAQENYDAAIPAFRRAAGIIPAPFSQPVWLQLGECLRLQGREDMAELVEAFAKAPAATTIRPVINIQITVTSADEAVEALEFGNDPDDEPDDESWSADASDE